MSEQPKKPSLTELMQMAQKMQESMRQAQEDLEKMQVKGSAGGDMVTVTMNGKKKVITMDISQQAYNEGMDILVDLCIAAFNQASDGVDRASEDKLKKLTQNLGLPPDFNFPTDSDN